MTETELQAIEARAKRGHDWDTNPWVWVVEFERAVSDRA